jgi:hypothetical protein
VWFSEDLVVDRRMILKSVSKKRGGTYELNSFWLRLGINGGPLWTWLPTSGTVKVREFIDWLSDYLLKEDIAIWCLCGEGWFYNSRFVSAVN